MIKLTNLPVDSLNLSAITGTALYGPRKNPVTGKQQTHHGVDLNRLTTGQAINNQPIKAVAAGTVLISKMQGNGKGYGNYIVINHGGWFSLCAHMSKRDVAAGQKVFAGQVIGTVGSTGSSTGPHLHFGVCMSYNTANPDGGSLWVDPLPYLQAAGKPETGLEEQEEESMKVYEKIEELTGDWRTAVEWALTKGIIKGNGKTMGLAESEVKGLVFLYRDNQRKGTV